MSNLCIVSNSSYAVLENSLTVIDYDSEVHDPDGWHSTVSNISRITVPTTGVYRVNFQWRSVNGDINTGHKVVAFIRQNGTTDLDIVERRIAGVSDAAQQIEGLVELSANDYLTTVIRIGTSGSTSRELACVFGVELVEAI